MIQNETQADEEIWSMEKRLGNLETEPLTDGSNRVLEAWSTQNGGVAIFGELMAEDFPEVKAKGVLIYVVHATCEREKNKHFVMKLHNVKGKDNRQKLWRSDRISANE